MIKYIDSVGLRYLWLKIKSIFENKSNKVTSITETSTDEQYPSAKAVFNLVGENVSPTPSTPEEYVQEFYAKTVSREVK